ncbi:MAG: nucleotidyl transferase AbiEii/AbiGii toxin family protein [bacterium]|nr:nucleotidyl transferase AbiEii/AbiGii toxin family protein [bacterium]
MEQKKLLNTEQLKFLGVFSKDKEIAQNFYLSGGTALTAYYIPYRFSQDLDFFSEKEFNPLTISVFLKKFKKEIGYKKFDFQKSFNRNLYFLYIGSKILKVEFTYYPFSPLIKAKIVNGIKLDSILDIAVNKTFTISQNPRTRDFLDLYFIIKRENFNFFDLLKKARIKFDWHIDSINLGTQLMKSLSIRDYPKLIKKIDDKKWQQFYLKIAKKLGQKAFI